MTDRIKGLTVTLRPNVRDDDAEEIISAIKLLAGVIEVEPHVEDDHFAMNQAKWELKQEMWKILHVG